MKSISLLFAIFLTLSSLLVVAQGSESFTSLNASGTGYVSGSYVGDGTITWTYNGCRSVTATHNITGRSAGFGTSGARNISAPSGAAGVGTLDYSTRSYFTGGSAADRTIELWVNGTMYETFTLTAMSTVYNRSVTVNETGNVTIEFRSTGSRQIVVDDVSWTAAVTCTAPSTQASASSSSAITTNSASINWTRGNGNNVLVVLQAGSAAGTPGSGSTYTGNSVFGSGTAVGSGFAVYNGTGVTVPVTNLAASTTYHYAIYEYATTGTCYLTPGETGNFTTTAIGTTSDIIASGGESALVPSTEITAGPLTSVQGIKVWDFTIRDGGGANDADALPTILEDLTITQSGGNQMDDWDVAIQSADLFDGTTLVGSATINPTTLVFTGMSITAADNSNKTITLRISLNCPSNNANNLDGDDFGFRISQGNVTETATGSQFSSFALINSTNAQNVYDIVGSTITSVTPTSGPVGTMVTINASGGGFTGATAVSFGGTAAASFTVISDTEILAEVATGTTSGDIVVTDAFCLDNTYSIYSVINVNAGACEGTVIFSDIVISEVYDNSSGSLGYIEIYNGTGAAVDLTLYEIERYPNLTGASTSTYSFPGTGVGSTIADGQVLVGRISTGGSGLEDFDFTGTGFNENDRLELRRIAGSVIVDDFHDAVVGSVGYVYRRNNTITGPNTTFTAAEWDATATAGDVSHLGTFNVSSGNEPNVTTQPTTSQICAESDAVLTTAGAEGFAGGLALAYQWYESAPGAAGWTAMTNGGVVSGATSATLTISPADGFNDYQYYCQVRENSATCYEATEAVQLDVYGDGGTAGLWTGDTDTDWCDCFNWHDGRVPTAATAVTINETATNDCIATTGCSGVGSTLTVSSLNGTNTLLTISGTGSINITNAIALNKSAGAGNLIVETTGSGSLSGSSITITGSGGSDNAILRNESASSTIDINGSLTIAANGLLDLNSNGTINLAGDFLNNNSAAAFDETNSTVIFDGGVNQNINSNGFTEVFHNITLAKTGGVLTLQDNIDTDISGVIALSDDQIDINSLQLRVLNPATGAFTRTSGSVIEESGAAAGNNAGKLIWDIGTTAGVHSFPFATGTGGNYIPFEFELTAGNAGEVSLSTYGTAATNLPWPSAPEVVTNLNSVGGLTPDNRNATADRFWQIDVENAATADITFSYQTSELPVAPFADHTNMIAQRYNSTVNQWEVQVHPGQTRSIIPGGFTVKVPNISTFSPWALAHLDSPLPAELIAFDVTKSKDVAILDWTTASEINTDEFILEKSKDAVEFQPFSSVQAAGNSNGNLYYSDIDYAPFDGHNYYRLKTVDFDGSYEYSDIKSVYFGSDLNNVVYQNNEWLLLTDNLETDQIQLINSLGQVIDLSGILTSNENGISLSHTSLANGLYIIQINNGPEKVNLKVIK